MKKTEVYKSDNGQLESDPMRAKAHDIAYAFDRIAKTKAIGTSSTGTSQIDWSAAMVLLENIDVVMPHLKEWDELRSNRPSTEIVHHSL